MLCRKRLSEILKIDPKSENADVRIAKGLRKLDLSPEEVTYWEKKLINGEIGGGSAGEEDPDYVFGNKTAYNLEWYSDAAYPIIESGFKDLCDWGFIADPTKVTYREAVKHSICVFQRSFDKTYTFNDSVKTFQTPQLWETSSVFLTSNLGSAIISVDPSNEDALCPMLGLLYNIKCSRSSTEPVKVVLGENIEESDQI